MKAFTDIEMGCCIEYETTLLLGSYCYFYIFFQFFPFQKEQKKQKRTNQKIITNLPTQKVVPLVKKH
jgi:hypothetical protein